MLDLKDFLNKGSQRVKPQRKHNMQKRTAGLTPQDGKKQAEGQATLPHPDRQTVKAVHDLLQSRFVKLFNLAKIDRSKYYDVMKTVTTNPVFRGIRTYHNKRMAQAVLNEVIGLGVISEIAREHPNVTDIVYNGRFLTYQTNNGKHVYGPHPGEDASILTPDYINQLINKFANNAENDKSVNKTTPIFDGMYKDMRISVCYGGQGGLTPIGYNSTFEIRVTQANLPMNEENFDSVAPMFVYTRIFKPIVKARSSIIFSGETGTGKTSLQKLLIGLIPKDQRIVAIEDTPEIHLNKIYPKLDVLDWITSKTSGTDTGRLIEESLRANPQWVMPTEVRDGRSAFQMLQSAKTGHSLMTTLHSKDNAGVPGRLAGMIRDAMTINEDAVLDDVCNYMDIGVHMSAKKVGGHIYRFIDEIAEFVPRTKQHPKGVNPLFRQRLINNHGVAYRMWQTYPASPKIKDTIRRNYDIENWQTPFANDCIRDYVRNTDGSLKKFQTDNNGQLVRGADGKLIPDANGAPVMSAKPKLFKYNADGRPARDASNHLIPDANGKPVYNEHLEKVPTHKD